MSNVIKAVTAGVGLAALMTGAAQAGTPENFMTKIQDPNLQPSVSEAVDGTVGWLFDGDTQLVVQDSCDGSIDTIKVVNHGGPDQTNFQLSGTAPLTKNIRVISQTSGSENVNNYTYASGKAISAEWLDVVQADVKKLQVSLDISDSSCGGGSSAPGPVDPGTPPPPPPPPPPTGCCDASALDVLRKNSVFARGMNGPQVA